MSLTDNPKTHQNPNSQLVNPEAICRPQHQDRAWTAPMPFLF